MANYNSSQAKFKVGSNFMEAYLNGNIEVEKVALTEDGTPLGSTGAVAKEIFVGITELPEITVEGLYDDTATTGPDAVFGAIGTSQTVIVTYGGTKTTTVTLGLKSYKRSIVAKELTKFTATLVNTGTSITEA